MSCGSYCASSRCSRNKCFGVLCEVGNLTWCIPHANTGNQHMKVSHSNTVWLGYIYQLYAKYSIGAVNMGE